MMMPIKTGKASLEVYYKYNIGYLYGNVPDPPTDICRLRALLKI
jgi:hypothetical protein